MARKSKPKIHSGSKSPSTSPLTSPLHVVTPVFKREVEETTTTAQPQNIPDKLSLESPEVQSHIHKLQGFSISPQKSEVSQGSVTSQFIPSHPLTKLQSEKLAIEPT